MTCHRPMRLPYGAVKATTHTHEFTWYPVLRSLVRFMHRCQSGKRTQLLPIKLGLKQTPGEEGSSLHLLMRFTFNIPNQCKVRRSRLGSLRKAKHLSRISTLRGKRLRTEVLNYLSHLNTESRELTREVNGDAFLKQKDRRSSSGNGVELTGTSMVQDSSSQDLPAEQVAGYGRTSGRKRTPKACDCCGPNSRSHLLNPPDKSKGHAAVTGKRGRKRKTLEVPAEVPPPDCTETHQANGASNSSSDGDSAADMEVELVIPCFEPTVNPLRDHHYCKTDAECSEITGVEGVFHSELLVRDINDEGIKETIQDFLEHFYGQYGSFIPLSENDVLEHLNERFNTDLSNRKQFIIKEVTKYRSGLASAPMHFFKVAHNKHTLTLEDLSTLDDQNWVNDQVINMYGELIMEASNHKVHFFNSFFHRQLVAKGYEGVKRWTKKVDLFAKSLLLIPIHLEIHWSLISVDIGSLQVNFYDSQGMTFKHAVDNILRYLLAEAKEKNNDLYQKGWKMCINKSIPQQKNDSDCGVFVLEYCKCLAMRKPLQFTQEDMPHVRKRIYRELCDCKLMDWRSDWLSPCFSHAPC